MLIDNGGHSTANGFDVMDRQAGAAGAAGDGDVASDPSNSVARLNLPGLIAPTTSRYSPQSVAPDLTTDRCRDPEVGDFNQSLSFEVRWLRDVVKFFG
jgi:hypothetical protein